MKEKVSLQMAIMSSEKDSNIELGNDDLNGEGLDLPDHRLTELGKK